MLTWTEAMLNRKLSAKRRKEIAKKAAQTRWKAEGQKGRY